VGARKEIAMYHTIVVPIDAIAGSDAAVPFAATVARQTGATVELLTVASPGAEALKAETALIDLVDWYGLGLDATARVVSSDDVGRAVVDAASAPGSLVCMQTKARGPVGELVLGSVSERVVRESHRPVLLVGPRCGPAPERFESMVVGLDGSTLAESILPVAAEWATNLGVTPWIYQVLPGRMPLEVGGNDVAESAYVHRIVERLPQPAHSAAEWDVSHDRHVPTAIARFAEDRPGALIALTTHGRSGLSRLALGSVALEVARLASIPVLVLRPASAGG
jgi:nucleotide-binding universal stress UspA family protein